MWFCKKTIIRAHRKVVPDNSVTEEDMADPSRQDQTPNVARTLNTDTFPLPAREAQHCTLTRALFPELDKVCLHMSLAQTKYNKLKTFLSWIYALYILLKI